MRDASSATFFRCSWKLPVRDLLLAARHVTSRQTIGFSHVLCVEVLSLVISSCASQFIRFRYVIFFTRGPYVWCNNECVFDDLNVARFLLPYKHWCSYHGIDSPFDWHTILLQACCLHEKPKDLGTAKSCVWCVNMLNFLILKQRSRLPTAVFDIFLVWAHSSTKCSHIWSLSSTFRHLSVDALNCSG